ncbi:MAG: chromate reductase [Glaciecola sp.]|jgi:chromate reductase
MRTALNILVIGGSLRAESINLRLARLIAYRLQARGAKVDVEGFARFDTPSFNQEIESLGQPAGADALAQRLLAADAYVLVSPEYNHSMPGYLKNTIDWLSRHPGRPLAGHQALLASASPSMTGGERALAALRIPLETLGTQTQPGQFALAQAHLAYDEDGNLADPKISGLLDTLVDRFLLTVAAVRGAEIDAAKDSADEAAA